MSIDIVLFLSKVYDDKNYHTGPIEMKKFCTSCRVDRDIEGGRVVQAGSGKLTKTRWKCRICLEKKNLSVYTNTKRPPSMNIS